MTSIVVTGASSGIGRATALLLAESGHQVFATVRKQADAQSFAGQHQITPVYLDVTNADQIADAVTAVRAQVGEAGLDGLVNNAGSGAAQPLELMSREELRPPAGGQNHRTARGDAGLPAAAAAPTAGS